jgi:hypothetical protein
MLQFTNQSYAAASISLRRIELAMSYDCRASRLRSIRAPYRLDRNALQKRPLTDESDHHS